LSFQKMCWSANCPMPIRARTRPSDEGEAKQPPIPVRLREQGEEHRERDQEEADVARREGDVGRVDRLQRVQADHDHQGDDQRLRQASQPRLAPQGRDESRQHARPNHRVQRNEQVDGLSSRHVQPDPERHSGDQQQRQQDRPAQHRGGADGEADDPGDDYPRELQVVRPQVGDVVPALAGDQGRRQPQRDHECGGSQPRTRREQRNRHCRCPAEATQYLERLAHEAPPGDAWMTRCSSEVATRSASFSSKRRW
jgi:hypothetical protein